MDKPEIHPSANEAIQKCLADIAFGIETLRLIVGPLVANCMVDELIAAYKKEK